MRTTAWLLLLLTACDGPPAAPAASTSPTPADTPAPQRTPAPEPADAADPSAHGEADTPATPRVRAGQSGELHYLEMMTGGADFDDRVPVIVAIHGLGDAPEGFSGLLEDFDRPARVLLPRGLDAYEPGWSWFPIRARDPDVDALAQGIERAADAIHDGLVQLSKTRPEVDPAIVTGFSQGGMLTFALTVRHPESVDAAVAVGGWLPPPMWPKQLPDAAPAIVALHGTDDPAVAFEPTREAVEALRALGWPASLHAYPGVRHAIPPSMRAELLELLRQSTEARASELAEAPGAPTTGTPP